MRISAFMVILGVQCAQLACCISWKRSARAAPPDIKPDQDGHDWSPSSSLPDIYSSTLNELYELESAPLCHRNAARLLVGNCQLLDGKDDATVLTDSGQASRDFVDSYAASLAICDLERGSFRIPFSCAKFQEQTLAKLSVSSEPHLHVSTTEIDRCLEGLAQSDSAWNTWVSYRHKALRFCETARADHIKDRDIRLYQKLTKIMARLTADVENHLEERLRSFELVLERSSDALHILEPRIDAVKSSFGSLEEMISSRLAHMAQDQHDALNRGIMDASTLQEMIALMVVQIAQKTEQMIDTQDNALQLVTQKVRNENELIILALGATMAGAMSVQEQIEYSRLKSIELGQRQGHLETVLNEVERRTESIASATEEHEKKLEAANSLVDKIAATLDSAAASATVFQSSFMSQMGLSGWWPYIYCPTVSLLLGSYGLPPSLVRNMGLFGLGEVAAFAISAISDIPIPFTRPTTAAGEPDVTLNFTTSEDDIESPIEKFASFLDHNLRRRHAEKF